MNIRKCKEKEKEKEVVLQKKQTAKLPFPSSQPVVKKEEMLPLRRPIITRTLEEQQPKVEIGRRKPGVIDAWT